MVLVDRCRGRRGVGVGVGRKAAAAGRAAAAADDSRERKRTSSSSSRRGRAGGGVGACRWFFLMPAAGAAGAAVGGGVMHAAAAAAVMPPSLLAGLGACLVLFDCVVRGFGRDEWINQSKGLIRVLSRLCIRSIDRSVWQMHARANQISRSIERTQHNTHLAGVWVSERASDLARTSQQVGTMSHCRLVVSLCHARAPQCLTPHSIAPTRQGQQAAIAVGGGSSGGV